MAHHGLVISASGGGGRKVRNSRPASATQHVPKIGAGDVALSSILSVG